MKRCYVRWLRKIMCKRDAFNGTPYAGNPHVRFDEGEVALATPWCGFHLCNIFKRLALSLLFVAAIFNLEAKDYYASSGTDTHLGSSDGLIPFTVNGILYNKLGRHYHDFHFYLSKSGKYRISTYYQRTSGDYPHRISTQLLSAPSDLDLDLYEIEKFTGTGYTDVYLDAKKIYRIRVIIQRGDYMSQPAIASGTYTYRVEFKSCTASVIFNVNGGDGASTTHSVELGSTIGTLPTPTRRGYAFDGWYTSASGGTKISSSEIVTGNVTYYAHWKSVPVCVITFDGNGGIPVSQTLTVAKGAAIGNLPVPTRDGYIFRGWYTHPSVKTSPTFFQITSSTIANEDVVYYAHWEAMTYFIRFHKNDGSGTIETRIFAYGKNQTLPWISSGLNWSNPAGKTFLGWSESSTATSITWANGATVKDLTSSGGTIDLYAVWQMKTYTVRFHKNDGSGTIEARVFERGKNQTLPWISSGLNWSNPSGKTFLGWSGSSTATSITWANGGTVKDLASAGGTIDLYAVWRISISPSSALDTSGGTIIFSGEAEWFVQNAVKYYGPAAMQTGRVGNNEKSCMSLTVQGPAVVSFWWKVSSEAWFDELGFYVDDVKASDVPSISGETEWAKVSTVIGSGRHTLSWRYSKDVSLSFGDDCGWVDRLTLNTSIYLVRFHKNDGSGTIEARVFERGKNQTLPWISSGLKWSNPSGKTFLGWSGSSTATSITWANGATVKDLTSPGGTINLYAVWQTKTYTVRFHKNDGSGTVETRTFERGKNQTLPWISAGLKWSNPSGKTFLGWSGLSTATSITWANGATVKDLTTSGGTINLYAVWSALRVSGGTLLSKAAWPTAGTHNCEKQSAGLVSGIFADRSGKFDLVVCDSEADTANGYFSADTEEGVWVDVCVIECVDDVLILSFDDFILEIRYECGADGSRYICVEI